MGRDQDMHRRELLRTVLSGSGIALTGQVLAAIEATRQDVDRTLSAGTISPAKMSLIEETVAEHASAYTRTPPLPMLGGTVLDFLELRQLAVHRQPAAVQGKLSEATARLATLTADALMKLGQLREARNWCHTARLAADDTGNLVLRARVRAQEGMLPYYYYGDPNQTVHLAREAQAIARDTPCAATALAAAAEARALARLGRREESETAMRHAQDVFERAAASSGDDAFSFPAQRLLFYLSGALTNLGETTRAADVQRQALDLYDQAFPIDPALLRLDQAIGLAGEDAVEDACHVA
jgi:tetratricopeptide (TPR) repeat protein